MASKECIVVHGMNRYRIYMHLPKTPLTKVMQSLCKEKQQNKEFANVLQSMSEHDDYIIPYRSSPIPSQTTLFYANAAKRFKHRADNVLNMLAQFGFETRVIHDISLQTTCAFMITRVYDGDYVVTNVCGDNVGENDLWLRTMHAYRIQYHLALYEQMPITVTIEKPTVLQGDSGEGPSTQLADDQLTNDEVFTKSQNTVITKEVDDSTNIFEEDDDILQLVAVSTDLVDLPELTSRFIRVIPPDNPRLFFGTGNTTNQIIFEINVPNGLYSSMDTTISTALRNFTLIKCDVEFIFKINANQAQCGRYIVSHWPCYEQINNEQLDNVYRMLQRDHAVIDVSKSNDVHYTVKYENLRPFLPVQTNEIGETIGGAFARLFIRCLTPVRIAESGNPTCPFQVFAKLRNVKLTGMRFPVPLEPVTRQMTRREIMQLLQRGNIEMNPGPVYIKEKPIQLQGVDDTLKSVNKTMVSIPAFGSIWKWCSSVFGNGSLALAKLFNVDKQRIDAVEQRLMYIGMINKDRPVDYADPSPLLPNPVHALSYGRGPFYAKKLRLEPEATTPHINAHKVVNTTQSVTEIAQVPGLFARFPVSVTNTQGDLLIELPAIPYDPRYTDMMQSSGVHPIGRSMIMLPPVSYVSGLYEYYSGSIEYEFVPVKTSMHNFSIQVAFIPFNGVRDVTTEEQLQSCDWKTIDFRTSPAGIYTVPWVSTNTMRSWPYSESGQLSINNISWSPVSTMNPLDAQMKDPGKVVVRLVNELNPTPIVSTSIEVLVFMRAHKNMRFLNPKTPRFAPAWAPHYLPVEKTSEMASHEPILVNTGGFRPVWLEGETNFQHGDEQTMEGDNLRQPYGPQIQTLEKHDNFIDVCRRWNYYTTLTGTAHAGLEAYFSPQYATCPIGIYAHTSYTGEDHNENFNITKYEYSRPQVSYRDAIAMCHRWGRGGIQVMLHSLTDFPLEISYRPPVEYPSHVSGGIKFQEERNTYFLLTTNDSTLFGYPTANGMPVEILEPRVNPILTLEYPFYNINNYLDMQALLYEDPYDPSKWSLGDYPSQDMNSLYTGQLLIKEFQQHRGVIPDVLLARNNFKVRVYTAIADDFQFYHFMGVPPVVFTPATQWTMTQHITSRVRTRAEIQASLIASGVEPNPGPPIFSIISSGVDYAFTNTANIMEELKKIVMGPAEIAKHMSGINDTANNFLERLKTILAVYLKGIEIVDIVLLASSLASAFITPTWLSVMTGFLHLLKFTGLFSSHIFSSCFARICDTTSQEKALQSDGLDVSASVITALIVEILCVNRRLTTEMIKQDSIFEKVKSVFYAFNFQRAGAISVFFYKFSGLIKWVIKRYRAWYNGKVSFDLLKDDPEFISSFMIEYEFFMNEMNLSQIVMQPALRDRFWTTVITAYYLKNLMAIVDNPRTVNPVLHTAVNNVIARANDLNSCMASPPVRYEPFCLWMYGPAGTGKTTAAHDIPIELAKSIGVVSNGDPIYTRAPGEDFWNGYIGQPIIHIDDASAISEPTILAKAMSEFQQLKSGARMYISKPRLSEKDAEVNSVILSVCSNFWEWQGHSMALDKSAFLRRRDIVIRVDFSKSANDYFTSHPGMKKEASNLPSELLEKYGHLTFHVHDSPMSKEHTQECNYDQMMELVKRKHKAYHEKEKAMMFKRYEKSLSLASNQAQKVLDKTTLRAAVLSTILGGETVSTQMESLKQTLASLKQHMPGRYAALPTHTQRLLDNVKLNGFGDYDMLYKNKNLGNDYVSTMFPHFLGNSKFPWKCEREATFDDNIITSSCAICRGNAPADKLVGFICLNSRPNQQHFVCRACSTRFHDKKCPTCREEKLVKITENQMRWSLYRRAQWITRQVYQYIASYMPEFNDHQLFSIGLLMISAVGIIPALIEIRDRDRARARLEGAEMEVQEFIQHMGLVPDRWFYNQNATFFQLGASTYQKVDNDFVEMVPDALQGKGKKEKKEEEKPEFDFIQPDFMKGVQVFNFGEQPSTSTSRIPTPPPLPHQRRDSSDSDRSFQSIPDWTLVLPVAQCTPEHMNLKYIKMAIEIEKRKLLPPCEEGKISVIITCDGKMDSLEASLENCLQKCHMMSLVNSYISQWLARNGVQDYVRKMQEPLKFDNGIPNMLADGLNVLYHKNKRPIAQPQREEFNQAQKSMLEILTGTFFGIFKKLYDLFVNEWKWIIGFITIMFAGMIGYKYVTNKDGDVEIIDLQGSPVKKNRDVKPKNRTIHKSQLAVTVQTPTLQSMTLTVNKEPPPNVSTIIQLLQKQVVTMYAGATTVSGIVVANNHAIFPRHGIFVLRDAQNRGTPIILRIGNEDIVLKDNIGMNIIQDRPDREMCVYHHKRITGKDIRHHFFAPVTEDIVYPCFGWALDIQSRQPISVAIVAANSVPHDEAERIKYAVTIGEHTEEYTSEFTDYLVTRNLNGPGKCGSIVLNPSGQIIGMHVAGGNVSLRSGFSTLLFKDDVDLPSMNQPKPIALEGNSDISNLEWICEYPTAPYHTEKSKILKSAIYEQAWTSLTYPCIQSVNDERYLYEESPLMLGASTIGAETNPPDISTLMAATHAVIEEYLSVLPTPTMEVPVSKFEAVTASNHQFVDSMNLNTSAGLPLIADNPSMKKKSDYVKHEVVNQKHIVTFNPTFEEEYDACFEMRKKAQPPLQPFYAHLKDERRKKEKLLSKGGTRVFSVAPLEMTISSRRVMLPFMDAFHSNPILNHHGIGLSSDSPKWTEMIEYLRFKGDKLIQLDFSKFSDTLPWEFVEAAFEVIRAYYRHYGIYSDEVDKIFDSLLNELTASYVCVGKDIYRLRNGVLQGHPLTTVLNSLVNIIEQVYIWIVVTGLSGGQFFKKCGIVVMGDDVCISIPSEISSSGYSAMNIGRAFGDLKIQVTDEEKRPLTTQKYQDFSKLEFISRSFQVHPYRDVYLAPADVSSIFDTPLWIRNKDGPWLNETMENVEQSLMLTYGHGPMIYEMYRSLLMYLLPTVNLRSWFDMDVQFMKSFGLERPDGKFGLGVFTGTSPHVTELLGADIGRFGLLCNEQESLFHSKAFLEASPLDVSGCIPNQYKCRCKFDCEKELNKRITEVELKNGVDRNAFLPFLSQEEGEKILGVRYKRLVKRGMMPRGYVSTIAFTTGGVLPVNPSPNKYVQCEEKGFIQERENELTSLNDRNYNKVIPRDAIHITSASGDSISG